MFDFRYHALSLVAVFLALAVGLLLGVAIGDQELVSSARRDLQADLRQDVRQARGDVVELERELELRRQFEDQAFPAIVADRLAGRRIALLFLDERSGEIYDDVREAIVPAGGELTSVSVLRRPLDFGGLADAAAGTRYEQLDREPDLVGEFGRRVGVQVATGGRLLDRVRRELMASSSGALNGAEAVVIVRLSDEEPAGEDAQRTQTFIDGLLDGLGEFETPVVGVERSTSDPSHVAWYRTRGAASVDNVDQVAGQTALVFALIGGADGAYGIKGTADALVPEALSRIGE